MKTAVIYFCIFFFGLFRVVAQKLPEKGVPLMQNFSPDQYFNNGKVWEIYSAQNGIVYFAADRGLLEYDGKNWNAFKGSDGFTRSLVVVNDSLIYTGSDLDFGVWKRNKYNDFVYESLYPFKKELSDKNEEFWDVHRVNDNIVFVSSQNIYVSKDHQLTKIAAPYKFTGSFEVNSTLYLADEKQGIFTFSGSSLKSVFNYPDNMSLQVTGMYKSSNSLVLVTQNSGLYEYSSGNIKLLDNALSRIVKKDKVFSFGQIDEEYLVFGTVLNGVYIADKKGKIIHHINKQKGLPNNTILSVHYSPSGKLWLGMDYGMSSLYLKNNFTYFYDFRGDFGTGCTALLKDGIFYLGTNQGLYQSVWDDLNNDSDINSFRLIPGTEGQVWNLENIDNNILCGHDKGLFAILPNRINSLSNQQGIWNIVPYKDYLLTGHYNGISIFEKSGQDWVFLKKMDLILGSCNQVIIEKDSILWVNIPNFGIIRTGLDKTLVPVNREIFEDDTFDGENPFLFSDTLGIKVITDTHSYTYQSETRKFNQSTKNEIRPSVKGLLPGIFKPATLNDEYTFYPVYNGFALKYMGNNDSGKPRNHRLIVRRMTAFNNEEEIIFHSEERVDHRYNNIKIECIVPNQQQVQYQFKWGSDDQWSQWDDSGAKEFLGLSEGKYTLLVRANIDGQVTEEVSVLFSIAAPWYRSWYAYISYLLIIGFVIYIVSGWQRLSLKKQKKKLLKKEQNSLRLQAEKHKQEVLLLEQEQLKSEFALIKQQLKDKTIELANKAKDNEDKNRLLITLKEKLDEAEKYPAKSSIRWNEMHRLLDSYLSVEDKTFEIQMDELHQDFFKKLKEKFPGLSIYDLRLCAYLKIGLNSREIADLLNVQPSSAYISRSRLRKKLHLNNDEDLYQVLNKL